MNTDQKADEYFESLVRSGAVLATDVRARKLIREAFIAGASS